MSAATISVISDAQGDLEVFPAFLPGGEDELCVFQEIVPRVIESPAEIVGIALLRDGGEVFPGSLSAEDTHVVPDPQQREEGTDQDGQEDHEESYEGVLHGYLGDHLVSPEYEEDPCQDGEKGVENALQCHMGGGW